MTPKITVTFVVGWPNLWPQNVTVSLEVVVHILWPNGYSYLCGRYGLAYHPEGHRVIKGRLETRDQLYDPKEQGDICALFDLAMTQKCQRAIRGRRDLLNDQKDHGDLCGRSVDPEIFPRLYFCEIWVSDLFASWNFRELTNLLF